MELVNVIPRLVIADFLTILRLSYCNGEYHKQVNKIKIRALRVFVIKEPVLPRKIHNPHFGNIAKVNHKCVFSFFLEELWNL